MASQNNGFQATARIFRAEHPVSKAFLVILEEMESDDFDPLSAEVFLVDDDKSEAAAFILAYIVNALDDHRISDIESKRIDALKALFRIQEGICSHFEKTRSATSSGWK